MKTGQAILVVSFGTSYQETSERNIAAIEREIAGAFPDWTVRRAFTSGMILRKLQTRDGIHIDTVAEALRRLEQEGFRKVVIQPTHILNGEEYEDIVADTAAAKRTLQIAMGAPLLTGTQDYQAVAKILDAAFPARAGTAVCLMGHGTRHCADSAYAALDYHLKDIGRADVFVGTVEGFPDLNTLMRHVGEYGPQRVLLTPLMVVAGDHAANDMAGDEAGSWKSAFAANGYAVKCVHKGLGEYPPVRALYVQHTKAAIQLLKG